ncbi:MAG: type II secretion system F family protein [Actinomycetota bacterium]
MPQTFAYKVRDRKGKIVSGTIDGEDQKAVAIRLREMGMTPINVTRANTGLKTEIVLRPGHVDGKDLAVFCRQFATMVGAGLPVLRAIGALTDQTSSKELAKVLRAIRVDVEAGASLTEAMRKHPKTFGNLFVAMIRTGETTGMLSEVLMQMADQLEAEVTLRGKVKSAMTYPIAVVGLVVVILIAMLLFVVPQFKSIYDELNAELPAPTLALLGLSSLFQKFWYVFAIAVAGAVIGLRRWIKTPDGRARWDALKISVPVFGPLFHKVAIARFSTTLALLLRAGVPILTSFDVVQDTVNNAVISRAISKVKQSVREGESVAVPLSREEVFPPMLVQMMGVGEESGSVDQMMSKVADFYSDEVTASVDALTSLIEPVLVVVIGVIVGGAVVSLYLPMFNIIKLIQ